VLEIRSVGFNVGGATPDRWASRTALKKLTSVAYSARHTGKVITATIAAVIMLSISTASTRHHHDARGTPSAVVVACTEPARDVA
jgi:hypothetical protein